MPGDKVNIKTGFEHLPEPIMIHLRAALSTWRNRPHVFHVTTLIHCLRAAWYKRIHPEHIQWSMKSLWNIYRGSIFDEKWTPLFTINQKNYRVKRREVTITGTCDFIHDDGDGPILYDLKMPATTFFRKSEGVGQGYRLQVQAYLALAHANGELMDIHRARVLMVAEDVVVEEVSEWTDMLAAYLWPRAFVLDAALETGDSSMLMGPEEKWECQEEFCPANVDFRIECARVTIPLPVEPVVHVEPEPLSEEELGMKELLY